MHNIRFFILCVTLIFVTLAHENDVYTVQYNTENFQEEIAKKNHFVMFYAPWCGYCQRLAPIWEELAEMLNQDDGNVKIAKVDCTTDGEICNNNDVTGYPTIKFFKPSETTGVKFKGTRDLPTLTNFINEQLYDIGDRTEYSVPVTSKGLIELTEETFEKHVASGKHFVKFYAPWCGHCQKLAPIWEDLAKKLEENGQLSVAKIDCTQFRSICNQFDIKGYPTLLWIEDGKKIEKYQGERDLEYLELYVTKMLGTTETGDSAGKIPSPVETVDIVQLNSENFAENIQQGVTFIKFFAPWCGHCKRLAPTWDELGKKFKDVSDVRIVKIDCTLDANKQLCSEQEVEGFPTVFLYKNGHKVSEYQGDRSLDDLVNFVKQHLSSHDEL